MLSTGNITSHESLAAPLATLEAPYEFREQVDRRRRISSWFSLFFPTFHRRRRSFDSNRISLFNHFPITEDLTATSVIVRTQFP